jgi:hypothetical protein
VLEKENKRRAGELLTAYGSIVTKMMMQQTVTKTDAMLAAAAERSKLLRAMIVFYLHMAWVRYIGGRRGIPLSIE